jgi:DNA-binding transcriptional regulator YiaG
MPPTGTWNHVPEDDQRSVFEAVDRDSLIKIQFGMSPDDTHHIIEKKPSLDGAQIPMIRENRPIRTSDF